MGKTWWPARLGAVSVFAFSLAASSAQALDKVTVQDGLKEAGWEVLPDFLDAATEDITIKFPAAMGGGTLKFGGTIDPDALKQKTFKFDTADGKGVTWNDAFGMPFLDLTDVGVNLEASKGSFAIALDGFAGGALKNKGKPREVIIDLVVKDKKITDFTLSLPDTSLNLHDIPGIKEIPGSKTFTLAAPTISLDAIGGQVKFKGETVDAMVFHDDAKKAWNMGLQLEKALSVAELIGHGKGFLKRVGLPKMRILMSHKGYAGAYGDLPLAAQQFFEATGDPLPDGDLILVSGVNVMSHFDPAIMPKDVKKALGVIGLNQKLEIDGTVEGLFGGAKSVELGVGIEAPADNGFAFLKPHAGAETKFFIKLNTHEQMLGFSTSVTLPGGKNQGDLIFDVAFALDERETGMEVLVAGDMRGDWKNAAGIKGLTLEDPFMSVGINQNAGFDLLLDGTVKVGKEVARVTGDIVVLPEAGFLPEAIAFAGTLNKLPMSDLAAHALKHAKINAKELKKLKAEFRDVEFAFMSPGSKLPADLEEKFEISGAGMAMNAALYLNNKELGKAGGHASTEGVKFDGEISPFKLGPLNLKDATLAIEASASGGAPSFDMSGDLALFKGFEEEYKISLHPNKFQFHSDTTFGGAFEAIIDAESKGLSFSPSNDFTFEAELAAKYNDVFKNLLKAALKGFKKADKDIKKAETNVKNAEKKVKGLKDKIARQKAHDKAAVDKATKDIRSARDKVSKLKREIDEKKKRRHDKEKAAKHDAKKLKLGKAAKEKAEAAGLTVEIAALETAKKTAEGVLKAAEKTTKVASHISPAAAALTAELGTAEAGLKTAEGVLAAARGANKGVEAATKAVLNATNQFKLNSLGAKGSLEGIISGGKKGTAPVLIIDVSLAGKRHIYREGITAGVKDEFEKLAKNIAHEVAQELIKVVKK